MTEYLKMGPLPSCWQNFDLKDLSVSESFEELLSLNSESKMITPKYFTGTYFGAMVAILIFCDLGASPKASPCHLFVKLFVVFVTWCTYWRIDRPKEWLKRVATQWVSVSRSQLEAGVDSSCRSPTQLHFQFPSDLRWKEQTTRECRGLFLSF